MRESHFDMVLNSVNISLGEALTRDDLNDLWRDIDQCVCLQQCEIYSFNTTDSGLDDEKLFRLSVPFLLLFIVMIVVLVLILVSFLIRMYILPRRNVSAKTNFVSLFLLVFFGRWSFNLFFVNRISKRILFFYCSAERLEEFFLHFLLVSFPPLFSFFFFFFF